MASTGPPPDIFRTTADNLLENAERCRRLADRITDRLTITRLLEMAKECEERAEELKGKRG
jgi:hypothetical protein